MLPGYTQSADGLLVPEGAQEAAATAALLKHDPDLRLTWADSDYFGCRVYRVYRRVRNEARPFETVCVYMDEAGNPLPLSVTGIVDMVQRLDKNMRGAETDPDVHNEQLVVRRRRDAEADFDDIVDEFKDRVDGKRLSPLPRSRSLHLARNRVRSKSPGNAFNP